MNDRVKCIVITKVNVLSSMSFPFLEGFEKPTERINFKAHRKRSLHGVNEHFEHRAMQKLPRAGGFPTPSFIEVENSSKVGGWLFFGRGARNSIRQY